MPLGVRFHGLEVWDHVGNRSSLVLLKLTHHVMELDVAYLRNSINLVDH